MESLLLFVVILVAVYLFSFVRNALRKQTPAPDKLYWSDDIAIQSVEINGNKIRYIKHGSGPDLLLLHTLRTQLDIFEKVIPELARNHTVYAMDYPGHGFSDIPDVEYEPELFMDYVTKFINQMGLQNATVAGVSIGGTICLLLAARNIPNVSRVVSINPYDYGKGTGVDRGNIVAKVVFTSALIPVIGETFMRLREPFVEGIIMQGGVSDPKSLTPGFLAQLLASGNRDNHYKKFINLLRNAWKWENAHSEYGNIKIPTTVVYGEQDWARQDERDKTLAGIPNVKSVTVPNGGHFLSMDRPEAVVEAINSAES